MRRALFIVGLLLASPLSWAARPASAQATRLVIAPLDGRGAGPARRAIRRALERRGYTVSLADTDPGDDPGASAALVEASGAEALLGGRARGRGERWRFDLWIRDARGGAQGNVSMRVSGASGIRRLTARLHDALQSVPTSSSPRADGSEPARAADAGPADPVAAAAASARSSREPPSSARASRDAPASVRDDDPLPVRALVLVGAGVRSRSVEILSPDGVDAGYRAEPFFEVTAQAEARFFDIAFVRARVGSSAGLISYREDPSLQPVDTLFTWVRADAGASVRVGDVALGAAFGVGWDRYELTFNELVPTAEYLHLRPAGLIAVHLVGRALVIEGEAGLRVPLGVGDLEALHGVAYSAVGADGSLRLRGRLDVGFAWSVELGARRYWLSFQRPDGEAVGTDGGWHATGYAGWEF